MFARKVSWLTAGDDDGGGGGGGGVDCDRIIYK